VPQAIRTWILARASTVNTHRDMVEIVARGKLEALPYVDTMLDAWKVVTV
jgi:hypothetical protein